MTKIRVFVQRLIIMKVGKSIPEFRKFNNNKLSLEEN